MNSDDTWKNRLMEMPGGFGGETEATMTGDTSVLLSEIVLVLYKYGVPMMSILNESMFSSEVILKVAAALVVGVLIEFMVVLSMTMPPDVLSNAAPMITVGCLLSICLATMTLLDEMTVTVLLSNRSTAASTFPVETLTFEVLDPFDDSNAAK